MGFSLFLRRLLDQVEDGDSVSHGREEKRPIRTEQQVALAVHSPKQIGELDID